MNGLGVFIVLSAAISGVIGAVLIARGWNFVRRYYYLKFSTVTVPGMPEFDRTLQEGEDGRRTRVAIGDLLRAVHAEAKTEQDSYHLFMGTAAASLLIGLLALGASITIATASPMWLKFLSAVDVACLGIAALCFFWAVRANRAWVEKRVGSELLRQWASIDEVLIHGEIRGDLTSRVFALQERLRPLFDDPERMPEAVSEFWRDRKKMIQSSFEASGLRASGLRNYVRLRPLRQLEWFYRSGRRLLHMSHVRARILFYFFVLAFAGCVVKAMAAFHLFLEIPPEVKSVVAFVVLLLMGCSAALATLYLNQNSRSLAHRYRMQERFVRDWLSDMMPVLASLAEGNPATYDQEVLNKVFAFEDLMVSELIDWISVTTNDSIELSL